ncbi:Coiled-coil domain-containing protein 77, partial [Stegodyphus mimosarum]
MVDGKTSSSSSISASDTTENKNLLEFYKRKFDEYQKRDDKFKEKVDKHLKDLIADRHELEAEVLRRGEKISDLQKALVELQLSCFEERERVLKLSTENEELKKRETKLHENIQQLLKVTKDQNIRDRIIYILKEPRVQIGYAYSGAKHKS